MSDVFSVVFAEDIEHFRRSHFVTKFNKRRVLSAGKRNAWCNAVVAGLGELNQHRSSCGQDHARDERPRR